MKTNLKNLPAILLLASAILMLMISCKKDNNSSSSGSTVSNTAATNMTTNAATADNAYDDAFGVALQTSNDNGLDIMMQRTGKSTVPVGIAGAYYCANVSVSGSAFPVTVTVDFGAGCKSADSVTRSGSITYVFSGHLSTPGTTISATFNNYVVNGHQLNGTYTIANTTTNIGSPQLTTTVTNGNIVFPGDTAYSFSGTKTVSIASGTIANVSGLIFNVTGNYNISSSYGDTLAATITTPLEKKVTCRYIDQGVISFTYTKNTASVNGTLDYGNGTCDDQALVTIGAFTATITIR
ncbi:MAG TPA: hypothetical protein VIJ92_15660 [Ginsengibacter sp.]